MPRAPILPTSLSDPTGLDALERRAIVDFNRRVRQCGQVYRDMLERIPFDTIETNARRYEFRLLPAILSSMFDEASNLVDRILQEGGQESLWFMIGYVQPANRRGTEQARVNLSVQSTEYARNRPTLEAVLTSEPYQRRLGLLRAREFEQMVGLSGTVKQQMSQVLTQGLATGIGPRQIAKNLTAQTGVEQRRAARIARTELGQALRQARLDESRQAAQDLGVRSRCLWLSALSPTTRPSHSARHAKIYTREEVEEFYSRSGESCNCKCGQSEILVDEQGNPLSPGIVERAKRRKLRYAGSAP